MLQAICPYVVSRGAATSTYTYTSTCAATNSFLFLLQAKNLNLLEFGLFPFISTSTWRCLDTCCQRNVRLPIDFNTLSRSVDTMAEDLERYSNFITVEQ